MKRDAPVLTLRAAVAPSTIDAEQRTVEVTFSTGAPVERTDWTTGRRFLEVLSLQPGHVDLARLNSGAAPLLDSHGAYSVASILGVVEAESARVVGGEARAKVRFSKRAGVADVWGDVADGVIKSVSVGYRVKTWAPEEPAGSAEKLPVRRAISWEPYELSLVPMPADAGATVRGEQMPEGQAVTTTTTTTPDPVEAERQRAAEITRACEAARLEPVVARRLIESGATIEQARSAMFEELRTRDGDDLGPRLVPSGAARSGRDVSDDFRAAASDALLLRAGIRSAVVHPGAQDIPGSVLEIARTCIGRVGRTVRGGSTDLLVRNAMSTSDFPLILADALHKAIRRGYEVEPASHRNWVRVVPVRDFKSNVRPILGSAPSLLQVLELGEYKQGSMSEDSATYTAAKYGRVIALSWETIVNDDLSAFLRVQPALGQAARRVEADLVYALFSANAGAGQTMQDNNSLFDSVNHANVTDQATDLDAEVLGEARALLRRQTALGGGYLSLVPRFLIVAPDHEQAAETLIAAGTRIRFGTTDLATEGRPEWLSSLEMVVEPRLDGTAAYLAADAAQIDHVELGLLEDNMNGPTVIREERFLQDAVAWKARHVCGAKALDWRGVIKLDLSGS